MAMAGMVIIGAGEGGVRAAFALREQGYDGPVTLLGAEDSLPCGRPPLSKAGQEAVRPIRPEEACAQARIDLRLGQGVTSIDPDARSLQAAAGVDAGHAIAKGIRVLEELIERGGPANTAALSDPSQSLKRLLKAA